MASVARGFDVTATIGRVEPDQDGKDARVVAMGIIADDVVGIDPGDMREYQFLGTTVTVKVDGY